LVLQPLRRHRVMTFATARSDGYPQATVVAFADERLRLFVAVDSNRQKLRGTGTYPDPDQRPTGDRRSGC
jgi:hypothetical protein